MRNLMLTMVLGGLWHGAAWNFVLWGTLHGVWLAIGRAWPRVFDRIPVLGPIAARIVTFHLVCFAWVFFRAAGDLALAGDVLARLGDFDAALPALEPAVVTALVLGAGTHLVPRAVERAAAEAWTAAPSWLIGVWLSVAIGLLAWASVTGVPFIYFQF